MIVASGVVVFPDGCYIFNSNNLCYVFNIDIPKINNMP